MEPSAIPPLVKGTYKKCINCYNHKGYQWVNLLSAVEQNRGKHEVNKSSFLDIFHHTCISIGMTFSVGETN